MYIGDFHPATSSCCHREVGPRGPVLFASGGRSELVTSAPPKGKHFISIQAGFRMREIKIGEDFFVLFEKIILSGHLRTFAPESLALFFISKSGKFMF